MEEGKLEGKSASERVQRAVDVAIDSLKSSRWQRELVGLVGLLYFADGAETVLLSFVYECVKGAFNLSTSRASLLVGIVYAGELVGSALAGPIADATGRKPASIVSALLIATFGLVSATSTTYWFFVVARFFVGCGIGMFPVPFDLAAEVLQAEVRGKSLTWLMSGYSTGAALCVGLAWLTLPTLGWRAFVALAALPSLVYCVAAFFILEESPKFYAAVGLDDQVIASLKRMAERTGTELDLAPVEHALQTRAKRSYGAIEDDDEPVTPTAAIAFAWSQPRLVCFGLLQWFAAGVTLIYALVVSRAFARSEECAFHYAALFLVFAIGGAWPFLYVNVIDTAGRRLAAVITAGLAAFLTLPWYRLIPHQVANILRFGILGTAYYSYFASLYIWNPELSPTRFRATYHTACYIAGRVGGFLGTVFVAYDLPINTAVAVIGASAACVALTAIALPDTTARRLL